MPRITRVDNNQNITINIILRSPNSIKIYADQVIAGTAPKLSPADYNNLFSASQSDINTVVNWANSNGLTVNDIRPVSRTIKVSGTAGVFNQLFHIVLRNYIDPKKSYISYTGNLTIPSAISSVVDHIVGFNTNQSFKSRAVSAILPEAGAQSGTAKFLDTLTPQRVADAYNFPQATGAGQCIAIIELGGGYSYSDLVHTFNTAEANFQLYAIGNSTYYPSRYATSSPIPNTVDILVDGGVNNINDLNSSGEVMLDIFVAGGVAPEAKLAIYFAPNTNQGFVDAINAAIHDTVNNPSVISISWAGVEGYDFSDSDIAAFESAFQAAAIKGITICASSGDSGSTNLVQLGPISFYNPNTVVYPGSSPYVLSCGGTALRINADNSIANEFVWNESDIRAGYGASGGGISKRFTAPAWQSGLSYTQYSVGTARTLTMRGVPDVSGCADPYSGYIVFYGGSPLNSATFGGTSAVAPLYAGLIARINQLKNTRMGFVNPLFYANTQSFTSITSGTVIDWSSINFTTNTNTLTWLTTSTGNSVYNRYPKLVTQVSPLNPAVIYTDTAVTVTTTYYNYVFPQDMEITVTDKTYNSSNTLTNQTTNTSFVNTTTSTANIITGTGTVTTRVHSTFTTSTSVVMEIYAGAQVGSGFPSYDFGLNVFPEASSGLVTTSAHMFDGNINWVGVTPVVVIGNSITFTSTVTNGVGIDVAVSIHDPNNNVLYSVSEVISTSPRTYSTTFNVNTGGVYNIIVETTNTNYPVYFNQGSQLIGVTTSDLALIMPGTPVGDGYVATSGWNAVTGLGTPNGTAIANLVNYNRGTGLVWPNRNY